MEREKTAVSVLIFCHKEEIRELLLARHFNSLTDVVSLVDCLKGVKITTGNGTGNGNREDMSYNKRPTKVQLSQLMENSYMMDSIIDAQVAHIEPENDVRRFDNEDLQE